MAQHAGRCPARVRGFGLNGFPLYAFAALVVDRETILRAPPAKVKSLATGVSSVIVAGGKAAERASYTITSSIR
jgi:hypothetical protein